MNGCCLTVVELGDGWWAADAQPRRSTAPTLGDARAGDPVNLERPVRLADRLGGHLVQGHVDGVGARRRPRGRCPTAPTRRRRSTRPPTLLRYVVEKGSITVDGVSLTVADASDDRATPTFGVALIPHTLAVTTLGARAARRRA